MDYYNQNHYVLVTVLGNDVLVYKKDVVMKDGVVDVDSIKPILPTTRMFAAIDECHKRIGHKKSHLTYKECDSRL